MQKAEGSRRWPVGYALQSLRGNGLHNAGIAIILALGISLIPAVMHWTSTGIRIETNDFVNSTVYQVGMKPIDYETAGGYDELLRAEEIFASHPWVKRIDRIMSTICIVDGHLQSSDEYPFNQNLYYVGGYKDARVILTNEETLSRWKPLFDYTGEFRISANEVVIGSFFVDYLELATGRKVDVGDSINIDIVLGAHGRYPNMVGNRRHTMMNLTIVGIFDLTSGTSVYGNSFVSLSRNLVDPFALPSPVLGVFDSIIVSTETIPDDVIEEVTTRSFFSVSSLVQADADGLLRSGESDVDQNMMSLIEIIGEPEGLDVWGIQEVENLRDHIRTYQESRIIVILAFPSLFIAIIIMINASESAILRRKSEASLLRTKGASYNQILTSYIWESIILFLVTITISLLLSVVFSVFMGASEGVLLFNSDELSIFSHMFVINTLGVFMAVIIGLALPMSYMMQIGRLIEVDELDLIPDQVEGSIQMKENIGRLGAFLCLLLVGALVMPYLLPPFGFGGVLQILFITILLYVIAQYGARFARQVLSGISEKIIFLLGEKSLYMTRSLKKRKGKLIPFLVILSLVLTTSNMMFVQLEGFRNNLLLEVDYAIGADLRIERENTSIYFNESLRFMPGIIESMPVLELEARFSDHSFYIEAIDPEKYTNIGHFHDDSFRSNSTEGVLSALKGTPNGVILSEYFAKVLNKTVGDILYLSYFRPEVSNIELEVVGFVNSAPGFGLASPQDESGGSLSSGFGFQVGKEGFVIANLDYMCQVSGIDYVDLFLVSTLASHDINLLAETIRTNYDADVYSSAISNPREISREVDLFLRGFESLTAFSILLLGIMGIFSILTLLSSSVRSRSNEYALLRAVGAGKNQVTSLVFQEFAGAVLAAIGLSLVVGIVLGISLTTLSFGLSPLWITSNYFPFVPFFSLGVLTLFELLFLLGACVIPARKAVDANPAELLRNL